MFGRRHLRWSWSVVLGITIFCWYIISPESVSAWPRSILHTSVFLIQELGDMFKPQQLLRPLSPYPSTYLKTLTTHLFFYWPFDFIEGLNLHDKSSWALKFFSSTVFLPGKGAAKRKMVFPLVTELQDGIMPPDISFSKYVLLKGYSSVPCTLHPVFLNYYIFWHIVTQVIKSRKLTLVECVC